MRHFFMGGLGLALLLAACGSGSATDSVNAPTAPSSASAQPSGDGAETPASSGQGTGAAKAGLGWPTEPAHPPQGTPSAADMDEARKHMADGVSLMTNPEGARYREAYRDFRKAYELSGSPNALQNLGDASHGLELDGEAIGYYLKYIEGKGPGFDPVAKKQLLRDLPVLQAATAWVTLSCDEMGVLLRDERYPERGDTVTNEYRCSMQGTKLGLRAGKHRITARLEGHKIQIWDAELAAGSNSTHPFVLGEIGGSRKGN